MKQIMFSFAFLTVLLKCAQVGIFMTPNSNIQLLKQMESIITSVLLKGQNLFWDQEVISKCTIIKCTYMWPFIKSSLWSSLWVKCLYIYIFGLKTNITKKSDLESDHYNGFTVETCRNGGNNTNCLHFLC